MWEGNVLRKRTGGREGVGGGEGGQERRREEWGEGRRGEGAPAAPGVSVEPCAGRRGVLQHSELGAGCSETEAAEGMEEPRKSLFHYLGQRSLRSFWGGAPLGWGRDRLVPRNRPSREG